MSGLLTRPRPCDGCAGPLTVAFHVVRTTVAVVNMDRLRQHAAMAMFFNAPEGSRLVENFAPTADAITLAAEAKINGLPSLPWTEVLLCTACYARILGAAVEHAEEVAVAR